jgi:hypothetical protein
LNTQPNHHGDFETENSN